MERNRAKRRLREAARPLVPLHGRPGFDYVFIARRRRDDRAWDRLLDDVKSALIRLAPRRLARPRGKSTAAPRPFRLPARDRAPCRTTTPATRSSSSCARPDPAPGLPGLRDATRRPKRAGGRGAPPGAGRRRQRRRRRRPRAAAFVDGPPARPLGRQPRVPIATPSLKGSLSLKGARIDDLYLTEVPRDAGQGLAAGRAVPPRGRPVRLVRRVRLDRRQRRRGLPGPQTRSGR